jgi:hypothetical protein
MASTASLSAPCSCLRYDMYMGDVSSNALLDATNYQTGSNIPTRKYGWSAYVCSGRYPSICQVPAEAFPCSSPPIASPEPPSPPQPPSPPFPPNCKLLHLNVRHGMGCSNCLQ